MQDLKAIEDSFGYVLAASDRRLSLVKMPRQPSQGTKRKKPLDEMPSSQTLEFVFHVRRGGNVIKKRTIEKMNADLGTPPIVFPDDDVLPAPYSQVDPPEPTDDASGGPSAETTSRSGSVSLPFCATSSPTYPSQTKAQEWISHRPEFLYELLRQEAFFPQDASCSVCKSLAEYRCITCYSKEVMCKGCLISCHSNNPLHSIQVRLSTFVTDSYN